MRKGMPLLVLALLLAFSAAAFATHEVDHRYHVRGIVVDSLGMPAMFVRVDVRDLSDVSVPPAAGTTDFSGGFDVITHLHNPNLGDQLRVTVAGQERVIIAQFDPSDATTERLSENLAFTIPAGANLVPYTLIVLLLVVPALFVYRRIAPRGQIRRRSKLGLDAIPGIGRARQRELKALGVDSLEKLATTETVLLADRTSLSLREAKRVVKRAQTLLEEDGPPT